ncbi:MAG TPA: hypothetical protein VFD85_15190 [Gemmatimonadales bacterium]|nr:hypothetical protein [Gemmatimonadales bacterium]
MTAPRPELKARRVFTLFSLAWGGIMIRILRGMLVATVALPIGRAMQAQGPATITGRVTSDAGVPLA